MAFLPLSIDPAHVSLATGWMSMLGGALSGMLMGLRFHRDDWLGGYASFRRRLVRLGHIAFFGLGFLNLLFAASITVLPLGAPFGELAAIAFVLGAATMPLTCFLTAWREPFRHLFAIPVVSIIAGIACVLAGWAVA